MSRAAAPVERVDVERLGGFAGFGGAGSALRSCGAVVPAQLPAAQRKAVEQWLAQPPTAQRGTPDGFRYRITVHCASGAPEVLELPESQVPEVLRDCVHDELK